MKRPARTSPPSPPAWADLTTGVSVTVVKRAPDGSEAARYPGEVVATHAPGAWVIVQAVWTYADVDIGGLAFRPGDLLLEWFSPDLPFNAFAVFTPQHRLRGWYANVTFPTILEAGRDAAGLPVLVWHDLYLDLVALPNGSSVVLDEDELQESGIVTSDPALHRTITEASAELQRRFSRAEAPFLPEDELTLMLRAWSHFL